MKKYKDLRKEDKYLINIVDLFLSYVPFDKKNKFLFPLLKILEKEMMEDKEFYDSMKRSNVKKHMVKDQIMGDDPIKILIIYSIMNTIKKYISPMEYLEFIENIENGALENNDITTYDKIADVLVANIEIRQKKSDKIKKEKEKEIAKQKITLLNDDKYLVLKPLTYEASLKYGRNTKWCTTTGKSYFNTYAQGNLIYVIDKKTNKKYAIHKKFIEPQPTYWDEIDNKQENLSPFLDKYVIKIINKDISKETKSNLELYNEKFNIEADIHKSVYPKLIVTGSTEDYLWVDDNNAPNIYGTLDTGRINDISTVTYSGHTSDSVIVSVSDGVINSNISTPPRMRDPSIDDIVSTFKKEYYPGGDNNLIEPFLFNKNEINRDSNNFKTPIDKSNKVSKFIKKIKNWVK